MLNAFPDNARRGEKKPTLPKFPLSYPSGVLNYYSLLSVPFDATAEQIRKAYLRFNRLAHPMTTNENLTHLFKAAQDAYDVLSKRETRSAYDAYLRKLNLDTMTSSSPLGVPLGSFPVVKLEEMSWGESVEGGSKPLRHIPGGNVESYQHAVVTNAVNLLLSIPGVSLYSGIRTPFGTLDHVGLHRGQVVVIGDILCPVSEDDVEYVKSRVDAAEWLKGKLGKVFVPDVKVFIAVLPHVTSAADSFLRGRLGGVEVLYGELSDMIDSSGVALLGAGRSSLVSKSYRKVLEGMKR